MEQESVRRDVDRAYEQAGEYFEVLAEDEKPRYILVSDFQTFTLRDSGERSTISLTLVDLAKPQGIGTGAVECLAGVLEAGGDGLPRRILRLQAAERRRSPVVVRWPARQESRSRSASRSFLAGRIRKTWRSSNSRRDPGTS